MNRRWFFIPLVEILCLVALPLSAFAQQEATATIDYYLIKYDLQGKMLWSQTYDRGSSNYAFGVAVDRQGNIIVTGVSQIWDEGELNSDYLTVKYSAEGKELWQRSFDSGGQDEAFAVATDCQGNILVGGAQQ